MTDHRRGQSYSREEMADCAMGFHATTGIAPHAQKHHFEILKKPRGAQNCTPDQTRELFMQHSDSVPVIKTGPETGVVALSVHTHDEDSGLFALAKAGLFCFCNDPFMEVITAWDDKCMSHHVLHFLAREKVFSRWAFNSLPGVVLLGSGEYAPIAPGYTESCHPFCPSVDYSYACGRNYAESGIPEMPEDLLNLYRLEQSHALQQERAQYATKGVKLELFDPISEGSRNSELTRRAGYLIGRERMSEKAAREVLFQINEKCCQPPLGMKEVADIARSISRRHARHG